MSSRSVRNAIDLPDDPQERRARALWSRMAEPYDALAQALVVDHSFTDLVRWSATTSVTPQGQQLDRFARRLWRLDAVDEHRMLRLLGARLVVPGDEEWPEQLDDLDEPPWCLWVRGPVRLDSLRLRSVAVVGSRASTSYGEEQTHQIVTDLVAEGFDIVSGAAYGIDGVAHRAALAVDGRTVAVLAGGVDVPYPRSNARMLDQIAHVGAVVSETPPGGAPARMRFLSRNRLVAGLSTGTLLVEAGLRSGARTTVRHARQLGRPVAVLPGPVTSAMSTGCHAEIRAGGLLVTDASEVVEHLGSIGADLAPAKYGPVHQEDLVGESAKRVWQWLRPRLSTDVDSLCDSSGLTVPEVLLALDELEQAGLAGPLLDGWIRTGGMS